MRERRLLIFISDIHLTDKLKGPSVPKEMILARFWERIEGTRGERPATLVFVGDLFDIVRSPQWFDGSVRPYHEPGPEQERKVLEIAQAIIDRERPFLDALRAKVESGALEIEYILGNHDRLLEHSSSARAAIWKALTGRDETPEFAKERVFPEHGVVAYHGHVNDFINHNDEGPAPIGDAIGLELIVRYPNEVRAAVGELLEELDDIDDVRPIFAVPSWVRNYASRQRHILKPATKTWKRIVEEFFDNPFTRSWAKEHDRLGFSEAKKLQLLLRASTGRLLKSTSDQKLVQIFRFLQQMVDGKFAQNAAGRLEKSGDDRLRYVVNGHSHFASMNPLGLPVDEPEG
ncbi:MAG: metallophosphoesterase, partial [Myxococcota bacterium]